MSADSDCPEVNDATDDDDDDDASTPTEAEDDPEISADGDSPDHISKEAWDSKSEEENSEKERSKFWGRFAKGLLTFVLLFVILILALDQIINYGGADSG